MSDSVWPHRQQPTRLPRPWDSPGKNAGGGCHFLLQWVKVKSLSRVRILATPWTAAYQVPPSVGFSRQEYCSGMPLPSPMIQRMLAIWSLVPLPFLKPDGTSGSSRFTYCWSLAWRILSITLLACERSAIVHYVNPNLPIHPVISSPTPCLCVCISISPCKQAHLYHFSGFHKYALIWNICFSLSDLLHSVW